MRKISQEMERLREEVLIRVRTVRRIRAFFASPAGSASFAAVFMLCASIFVSFRDIFSNIMAQSEWGGRVSYAYSSLVHTQIVVQVLAVLTTISCLILAGKMLFKLKTPVFFVGSFITSRIPLKFLRS